MQDRLFAAWVTGLLLATLFALAFSWPVAAQVESCDEADVTDPDGDVNTSPAGTPTTLTGFDRIDLIQLCIAESDEGVHFVITVDANIAASGTQEYAWELAFDAGDVALPTCRHTLDSGGGSDADGDCPATIDGARIQFTLPRALLVPGTNLTGFVVTSEGSALLVASGSDRMPDEGTSEFAYVVGGRAGDDVDFDGDGIPDRVELDMGTDPTNPDTDGDGLLDGDTIVLEADDARMEDFLARGLCSEEAGDGSIRFFGEAQFGTDPLNPDTDGDGLLDGCTHLLDPASPRAADFASLGIVSGEPNAEGDVPFYGELEFGTDPLRPDTDGDGLTDGEEVSGALNRANGYTTSWRDDLPVGNTNPTHPDTDGDGLTDGEEVFGVATIAGQEYTFPPTDPNRADTSDNGFDDRTLVLEGLDPTDPEARPDVDEPGAGGTSPAVYLPLSLAFLAVLVLLSAAGILWRWA